MRKLQFNELIKARFRNTFLWLLATCLFSFAVTLVMFYYEKDINPGMSGMHDVAWWWIVTVSGVGYGDIVPITGVGKLLGGVVMASSLILLAIVISELTALIKLVYEHKQKGIVRINYTGHVVIYGYTSLTAGVIKLLRHHYGRNLKIVLISNDVSNNPFLGHVDFIHANPITKSTFREANVKEATAAIILANDRFNDPDAYSLVIASGIERENVNVITLVEIMDNEMKELFKEGTIDGFINRKELLKDLIEHTSDPRLIRVINKQTDLDEVDINGEKDSEDVELV